MRSTFLAMAGILLSVATSGLHAQKQFGVFVSLVDVTGAPVETVQPTDIHIQEDGVDATVLKIEPINWPTKVQLLVDNGIGLGSGNINHLKTGITGLLDMLPPGVEVTIVATSPQPRFLARATTDRAAMMKGLALLSPDGGTGRFLEALNEATQRIERDKSDHFPVIVILGTTAGDRLVLDSDVARVMKRLEQRPTTVHVVMLASQAPAAFGGGNQIEIGLAVTNYTKGKYENINGPTRLSTLLPEIGALVARNQQLQSHQFRVTVKRADAASGDLGAVSLGARPEFIVKGVSLDGRIPSAQQ